MKKKTGALTGILAVLLAAGLFIVVSPARAIEYGTQKLSSPKAFNVEAGSRSVDLRWSESNSGGTSEYRVVRSTDGAMTMPWQGQLVFEGWDFHYQDTNLENGQLYYYTVFALDDERNYSAGVTRQIIPNVPKIITVPEMYGHVWVKGFSGLDGSSRTPHFMAFGLNANNGGYVAAGDVDGDGKDEIVVGARFGAPQVRVFEQDGSLKHQFYSYASGARFGTKVAVGDVNRDGRDEIVTAPGYYAPAHIRVFKEDGMLASGGFFAYPASHNREGVSIALGDTDGDGADEIVVGDRRALNTNEVQIFEYWGQRKKSITGLYGGAKVGIKVATGDTDGDGVDEVICGPTVGGGPLVQIVEPETGRVTRSFFAFNKNLRTGANVAAYDIDSDTIDEVIVATGEGSVAHVRAFEADGTSEPVNFFPYGPGFRGGAMVAAGNL